MTLTPAPATWVAPLSLWQITRVHGDDAQSYLQGQLSCDIKSLSPGQHSLSAHCDPKGKTWSVLRIICLNDKDYLYIQPSSVAEKQLSELKKFAVFSKVEITTEHPYQLFAVMGKEASHYISQHYDDALASYGGCFEHGVCLRFEGPQTRYLLLSSHAPILSVQDAHIDTHWLAAQIASGLPMLESATSGEFIPQALNLHKLDAISFNKGCYTGQEVVARARYRGTNKRGTFRFVGHCQDMLSAGDSLDMQLGENWRAMATVLQAVKIDEDCIELLAVAPLDIESDANFRASKDHTSVFTLAQLPYNLSDN